MPAGGLSKQVTKLMLSSDLNQCDTAGLCLDILQKPIALAYILLQVRDHVARFKHSQHEGTNIVVMNPNMKTGNTLYGQADHITKYPDHIHNRKQVLVVVCTAKSNNLA